MTNTQKLFRVRCVNPVTGRVVEFLLEAATEAAARRMAHSVGLKDIEVRPHQDQEQAGEKAADAGD